MSLIRRSASAGTDTSVSTTQPVRVREPTWTSTRAPITGGSNVIRNPIGQGIEEGDRDGDGDEHLRQIAEGAGC